MKAFALSVLLAAGAAVAAAGPHSGVRPTATTAGAGTTFPALAAAVTAATAGRQDYPVIPLDGRFVMARIYFEAGGGGGFGFRRGFRGGDPPWHHDYPFAERNFTQILRELTYINPYTDGGNVFRLDDPLLTGYPIAYMSEPGAWVPNDKEVVGLRNYLEKGGFIIFDDFGFDHMYNLVEQMRRVLPELQFVRLQPDAEIFDSFFLIDINTIVLPSYRGGNIEFWGIFEDNDPSKRLMAIAGVNGDLGEFWEYSGTGFYPVDLSNEAYKVGVNYVMYALTH
jgi:hypothetical protein